MAQAWKISGDTLMLSVQPSANAPADHRQMLMVRAVREGPEAENILESILQTLQQKQVRAASKSIHMPQSVPQLTSRV